MQAVKQFIKKIPVLGKIARKLAAKEAFHGSRDYWANRYDSGNNSGAGSYGKLAEFKAEVINKFVAEHDVKTLVEFGCGDGNQLGLAAYPHYIGLDVAPRSIEICKKMYQDDSTKEFHLLDGSPIPSAELGMSLDVIYHLVEDQVYEQYMRDLFDVSSRFVIVYSSNKDEKAPVEWVRHRKFTTWIEQHQPDWTLLEHIPNRYPETPGSDQDNTSFADFYIFEKRS
tara:strand:- start:175 stop:852 length:678 start_codon:yes stop_codon:yes gene_type:complete